MKKILFIALLAVGFSATAQTKVTKDAKGNFIATATIKAEPKETGKTFTDSKGVVYPLYLSKKGKYFYIKTAKKSGNKYNVYLKTN